MGRVLVVLAAFPLLLLGASECRGEPRHGISAFGDLKYPPGFAHFDYVNPDAPKGGTLKLPGFRTFDTLNPFTLKGSAPTIAPSLWDPLMVRGHDEPSARYGLIAQTAELPPDASWVEFELNPKARWHDGRPITADDVVFTIEVLQEKGHPRERINLRGVTRAEKRGPRTVRVHLAGRRPRQLALRVADLRVLPRHDWEKREFEDTTLEISLASGPYRLAEVSPGERLVLERVPDYWARDLNVNVGHYNFDRITVRYFQDLAVLLEGIKAHVVDWNVEGVSKVWATGYETPAKERGHLVQEIARTGLPIGYRARAFNLRRKKFQDPRVREALVYAYDHQWKNNVLTYHEYEESRSFFQNTDMEHRGPPSPEELELLEPFRAQLDPRVFERQFDPPRATGYGRNRENLKVADRLLREAGWVVRDGVRVSAETGRPFEIEIVMGAPAWVRVTLAYADSLERLGIKATIRSPFSAEYIKRVLVDRDFDIAYTSYRQQLVPDNRLRNDFHSSSADQPRSRNLPGIDHPVVDALIERVLNAKSREELVIAARALDRVLCWGFYMMGMGHTPGSRYAYWNRFGRPERGPRFDTGFPELWWLDREKDALIEAGTPIPVLEAGM